MDYTTFTNGELTNYIRNTQNMINDYNSAPRLIPERERTEPDVDTNTCVQEWQEELSTSSTRVSASIVPTTQRSRQ